MTQAFPLQWPAHRKRTKARTPSAFKVSASTAYDEMMTELNRFGATSIVVSSNIPLRRDGTPYRDGLTERLDDPGVAVYFTKRKRAICLPCDTYPRPWENIRAIGLSVKSFRDIERYGAEQILDQAFEGFAALPPPGSEINPASAWWVVLGCSSQATTDEVRAAYKAKAREAGGASVDLNAAKDAGLLAAGER